MGSLVPFSYRLSLSFPFAFLYPTQMTEPFLEPIVRHIRFRKVIKQVLPNSVVVDIGCGHTPHLLNRLEHYIKNGYGVDQLIESRKGQKITLISKLLVDKIPLRSGLANHVTLVAVLEHLENPDHILKESYRLLKKGGTLILTTPSPLNKPLLEFLAFKVGVISRREIAEHKRYFWKNDLLKALRQAGFKKIDHQ